MLLWGFLILFNAFLLTGTFADLNTTALQQLRITNFKLFSCIFNFDIAQHIVFYDCFSFEVIVRYFGGLDC